MLFLGGGNYSLRRDPLSAACLLLSLCPRFPFRTVDHQYHMQALRHLYVLAAEPRALHTIDVDTGLTVSVRVQVELVDGSRFSMVAPGLLPELASIRRISVVNAPDDNDNVNADGGSAPLVQYYPTSIVMQGETKQKSDEINVQVDDCCHQSVEEILRSTKSSVLRGSHQHTAVPPLFVKRIPVVVYSSPSSCTSSSDRRGGVAEGAVVHCAQSLLAQALQQAALPRAFSNADNLSAEFVRRNEVSVVRTKELLAGLRGGKASADNGISSAMMENDLFAAIVLGAVSANS